MFQSAWKDLQQVYAPCKAHGSTCASCALMPSIWKPMSPHHTLDDTVTEELVQPPSSPVLSALTPLLVNSQPVCP